MSGHKQVSIRTEICKARKAIFLLIINKKKHTIRAIEVTNERDGDWSIYLKKGEEAFTLIDYYVTPEEVKTAFIDFLEGREWTL